MNDAAAAVAAAMQDVIRAHTAAMHPDRSCFENERGECADRFGDPNPCPSRPDPARMDDDECVLVVREGVGVMCVRDHTHPGDDDEFAPYLAEQLRDPEVKAAYDMEMRSSAGQARRRWWHRLTRTEP